jgi:hypothetical protein
MDDSAMGQNTDSKIMSRSEYESWYEKMFGRATAKDVTHLDMTDENINSILKQI